MKHCLHPTQRGSKCQHGAGWGTDHAGSGHCKVHDSNADAEMRDKKARALELVAKGTNSLVATAGQLGVHVATIARWRMADTEFDAAMTSTMAEQDATRVSIVEDQLFYRLSKGKASAAEMIFYLVNRSGGRWQHVQRIEHTGREGTPLEIGVREVVVELPPLRVVK